MILSAVSLWNKFNLKNPLGASEWGIEERGGVRYSFVTYSGHEASDGSVRIYARFARPIGAGKKPTVLLLPDAGQPMDEELVAYFLEKGYAVKELYFLHHGRKILNDPSGVLQRCKNIFPSTHICNDKDVFSL